MSAEMHDATNIRPSLLPRTKVRKWGAFCFAAYVVTHDVLAEDGRRIPMWLYSGTRRTRRSAQRLADEELTKQLDWSIRRVQQD